MKKEKLIEVLKSIFENAKRIHGNSDSVDYVEVAIYRAATYLSKEDKFDEHYKRDDEFVESYLSKEQEVEGVSWNTVKEKYLEFHKMDSFTENMAIDIDFGYWLMEEYAQSSKVTDEKQCKCKNSHWNRDAGCMVCDECGKEI